MKTKKLAVIIKHPMRDNDYRVDIYEVPEYTDPEILRLAVQAQMLGPFEAIAVSERIGVYSSMVVLKLEPLPNISGVDDEKT